nr:hypothetical protein [Tanacetum cinerariifolium]
MHIVNVDISQDHYFSSVAKISNERYNFFFKLRILKSLTRESRAYMEHVSNVFNIKSETSAIHLETKRMMMSRDSGPELLHVDCWYTGSDLKGVVERIKKHLVDSSEAKASVDKPKDVRKNFSSLLIENWISDSEDEAESKPKIEKKKPSFAIIEFGKSKEHVKSLRKTTVKQAEKPKQNTHRPKGNQNN